MDRLKKGFNTHQNLKSNIEKYSLKHLEKYKILFLFFHKAKIFYMFSKKYILSVKHVSIIDKPYELTAQLRDTLLTFDFKSVVRQHV